MTKLQKFNTILFSLIGSGIVLFAVITAVFWAIDYYTDWKKPTPIPLSNQEVTKLVQENLFKQTISYNNGYWAWTDNITDKDGTTKTLYSPYYIIPVAQTTLEDEQQIPNEANYGFAQKSRVANYYRGSRGKLNNILLYNTAHNSVSKIFTQRLLINNTEVHKYNDEHFLIIQTQSLAETRNNDKTAAEDFYIYRFEGKSLTKLNAPKLNDANFFTDHSLPVFLIRGRIDFDENGKFDQYDPYRLFSWNFETQEIKPFPEEPLAQELQKILDGRTLETEKRP